MKRIMTWFSLISLLFCLSLASFSRATVTTPTLTPANLPATGGTITVSATVSLAGGISSLYAQLYRDGVYYTQVTLSNGNAGLCYTGTYTISANTDAVAHTFTAIVIAVDGVGNQETATASGSCVVANDNTPPLITNATLTPTSIPAAGGTLTVTATVTDAGSGVSSVLATILYDGTVYDFYHGETTQITLSNDGSGNVYSGTCTLGPNDYGISNCTANITATDAAGNSVTVVANGSCVQPSETPVVPPAISDAELLPATLPAAGGTITINATITDDAGPGVKLDRRGTIPG